VCVCVCVCCVSVSVTTQEVVAVVVDGDGRLQDSEFCNIRERGSMVGGSWQGGALVLVISGVSALKLLWWSLSLPLSHTHTRTDTHTHTHTHTHVNPPLLCQPPCKVDPYYPPSQTRSALSTSSGQLQTKKLEMRGVTATWPGSANPLILALSFLLSPSFLCPQRKKRKNCNFFIAC